MKRFYASIILNEDKLFESNCNKIELEYYKISNKHKKTKLEKSNIYGIEIVKKEYIGNKRVKEKTNINNLTSDENIIDNLLYMLRKNTVTPIGLKDVLQEML